MCMVLVLKVFHISLPLNRKMPKFSFPVRTKNLPFWLLRILLESLCSLFVITKIKSNYILQCVVVLCI